MSCVRVGSVDYVSCVRVGSVDYVSCVRVGSVDYVLSPIELTLTGSSTCFNVEVMDDTNVEKTEVFTLSLSSTDPLIRVTDREANINILDNDSKLVNMTIIHNMPIHGH